MTIEYAHRIAEAAGLDIDLDCEGIDLQDKLYGLFQCFILQARIMPIYAGGLFKALFQAVSGRMAGRI